MILQPLKARCFFVGTIHGGAPRNWQPARHSPSPIERLSRTLALLAVAAAVLAFGQAFI